MNKEGNAAIPPENAPAESKPGKDKWDIIEILARPISAALTALTIALIGYFGQSALTEINAIEQDARLYTQLLSSREAAESSLRKDMFKEIMDGFFTDRITAKADQPVTAADIENSISKKLLKLEMLALNFGDSLSLGPLFGETSKDIKRILKAHKDLFGDWRATSNAHHKRLHGLAKRVASAQLSTVGPKGEILTIRIPYEKIKQPGTQPSEEWQYTWPYDDQSYNPIKTPLNTLPLCTEADRKSNKCKPMRSVTIELRNGSYEKKSVQINLIIENLNRPTEDPTKINFRLDYFNFPLIDNTRLSNNERFAIILEKFNEVEVILKGVLFPGIYASQRDKPYLNEAIQELKRQKAAQDKAIK